MTCGKKVAATLGALLAICCTATDGKCVLDTAEWHAEFMPARLGNMTRLQHRKSGTELLRTPPDEKSFLAEPVVWGVPVIFPPNRTPRGEFTFRGREYHMPVNAVKENNNLHGVLLDIPWECRISGNTAELSLHHSKRDVWPHEFSMTILYEFDKNAVRQTVTTTNLGPDAMPFFIGFHTALAMPPDRTLRIPHKNWRFALSTPSLVPDGKRVPCRLPDGFFAGGTMPGNLGDLIPVVADADGFRGVEVRCPAEKTVYRYSLGPEWKYWMCWNARGKHNLFCAEPMSGMVDCLHHQDDPDSGFDFLEPGESRVMTAEFSIREL